MTDSADPIIIAIDGNGGDNGYRGIAKAVQFALTLNRDLRLRIIGDPAIGQELRALGIDQGSYELVECTRNIPQDAEVLDVLEHYQNSSMYLALRQLADKKVHAVVSSGGTGPLVTISRHLLGSVSRLRPALCAKMPYGPGSYTLMLDLGANARAQARDLHDFALLGAASARNYLGIENPRVALLNVGTEEHKGNDVIRGARDMIREKRAVNYTGFIEADHIFTGQADVIVTDGFSGNIALKAAEGLVGVLANGAGLKKFFAKLARPEWLLPWQYNGSILLGVDGVVIKSHASASTHAMAVAIVEAARCVRMGLIGRNTEYIEGLK